MLARILLSLFAVSAAAQAQLLQIIPAALPDAFAASSYATFAPNPPSFRIVDFFLGVGGQIGNPFAWSIPSGRLPSGLVLDAETGQIRGIPIEVGVFNFTAQAIGLNVKLKRDYTLTVRPLLNGGALPAQIGATFPWFQFPGQACRTDQNPFSNDPPTPFNYRIVEGSLPPGLTLHSETGGISGEPTEEGGFLFLWQCASKTLTGTIAFTAEVGPVPKFTFVGVTGEPFEHSYLQVFGRPPLLYRTTSGKLPPGIAHARDAAMLSGTPTTPGTYEFTVLRTDDRGFLATADFHIAVDQAALTARPTELTLTAPSAGSPVHATVRIDGDGLAQPFQATVDPAASAWLSVSPSEGNLPVTLEAVADPLNLARGPQEGSISILADSAQAAQGFPLLVIPVRFDVTAAAPPELSALPSGFQFSFARGAGPETRFLTVRNAGSGMISFDAAASTRSGGPWLSVTPAAGEVGAGIGVGAMARLAVTADPALTPRGTYAGAITLTDLANGNSLVVPVTMSDAGSARLLEVSQTGLEFRVNQGGAVPPARFSVLNLGLGELDWTARVSTLSGGDWLAIDSRAGQASDAVPAAVEVSVQTQGLQPGVYYGLIDVESSDAAGSPRSLVVALNVEAADVPLRPLPDRTAVLFLAPPDDDTIPPQTIQVTNPGAESKDLITAKTSEDPRDFFSLLPQGARVEAGASLPVDILIDTIGLAPGVHRGQVHFRFDDSSASRVDVVVVVAEGLPPGGVFPAALKFRPRPSQLNPGCTPTELIPVLTKLGDSFEVVLGQPAPVEAVVVDDCGNFADAAAVTVAFPPSASPIPMTNIGAARYTASVTAADEETNAATVEARQGSINGSVRVGGSVIKSTIAPVVNNGGAVSAASFAPRAALSPGGFVSIFGKNLARGVNASAQLPFENELDGTEALISGRPAPLHFTAPSQINAIWPYGLEPDVPHQLIVRQVAIYSLPEPLVISTAQPAVFTQNLSGSGAAAVLRARADGSRTLVTPSERLAAGDFAIIFCAGLGPVDPPVEAGSAAPSVPPLSRTVNAVKVTIGGVEAEIVFSGLAPGFAGLYQINAKVAEGTPSGADVPLVIEIAGQISPTVTVAVE